MNGKRISQGSILYLGAFALALILRFILLGRSSLNDSEAVLALSSMSGNTAILNPAYTALTRVVFFIWGGSAFQARFLSALTGSILVISPLFYKRWLGEKPAVLLSFLLAIEPGLLAVSRQADGTTLVVASILFAVGAFLNRKPIIAGLSFGIFLLGGVHTIPVILAVGLAFLWTALVMRFQWKDLRIGFVNGQPKSFVITLLITLVGLVILGFIPGKVGFTNSISSLPLTVQAMDPSQKITTLFMILSAWLIYSPVLLVMGISGLIRGLREKSPVDQFLARWLLVGIVIIVVNPNRNVLDLAWAVVPLLGLAARQLIAIVKFPTENRPTFFAKAIFDFVILGFVWLNLVGVARSIASGGADFGLRLLAIAGGLLMIILVTILIGWGWSWRAAISGFIVSLMIVLTVDQVGMTRRAAGLGTNSEAEIWLTAPYVQGSSELHKIIKQFSVARTSIPSVFETKVLNTTIPSLVWGLKDIPNVEFIDSLDPQSSPAFVITATDTALHLAANYRGEVLDWKLIPIWNEMGWRDWVKWLAFREAPIARDNLVLWIREDVFPTQ